MSSCAVVISGGLKTYQYHLQDFYDRIVKPNNADVYIEFQPDSAIKDRNFPDDNIEWKDAEDRIRTIFGTSVKHFSWLKEHPDKNLYLETCGKKLETWRRRYGDEVFESLEHHSNIRPTVDQYLRARHIVRTASKYPEWKNYTNVLRMRIDCAPTDIFPFQDLKTDNWKVYVQPSTMPFEVRDQWFMGNPKTIERIVEDFMEVYLTYHIVTEKGLPSANADDRRGLPKTILSPEFQLGQYLTRTKPFRLYKAHFDFKAEILDGVQQFVVESKPSLYQDNRVHFIADTYQDYHKSTEVEKTLQNIEDKDIPKTNNIELALMYTVISIVFVLVAYIITQVGFQLYKPGDTMVSVPSSFNV